MKKENSKKFLAFKKASVAQLNEKGIEGLKGGSSYSYGITTCFTITLISDCTSIACMPEDDY